MKFQLINPSDPYTFEADDLMHAAIAVCIVGQGRYGADQIDGEASVPTFLFGGHDKWFEEQFQESFEACLNKADHLQLSQIFDSFVIGNNADRYAFDTDASHNVDGVTLTRHQHRLQWHEKHRSSTNDIGAIAWAMADQFREAA